MLNLIILCTFAEVSILINKSMKYLFKSFLALLTAMFVCPAAAQLSEYDLNKPLGWATVDGTITGSNDENAVTVTTLSELKNAFSGTDKKTIYIKGEIEFTGSVSIKEVQNKTVYGLPGSVLTNKQDPVATKKSGVLNISKCKNVILRNITFKSAGAYDIDGNDNLTLDGSTYIWIDHCDFQDGVDGNFDCVNGSDNICVTWCRFRYLIEPYAGGSGGSNDHRNSNLWGNRDGKTSDADKLRTTFANCWWDEGCSERMPRVRYGKVHVVNCLYTCADNVYCIGAGYKGNIYAEKCVFIGVNNPWKNYATSSGKTDYNIIMTDCIGQSDVKQRSGSIEYFNPYDYYTLSSYDNNLVQAVVSNPDNGAGATLQIEEGGKVTTAIDTVEKTDAVIVSTHIFNSAGVEATSLQRGLNIVKHTMSDGTTRIIKIRK